VTCEKLGTWTRTRISEVCEARRACVRNERDSARGPTTLPSKPSTHVERPWSRRTFTPRVDDMGAHLDSSTIGGDTDLIGAHANYPTELEAAMELESGTTLLLRPIRAQDEGKLLRFHGHLSPESIYTRYFSFHPELSPVEVEHLTHVDYIDRLALVIEDGDELVGVARYERYPGTSTNAGDWADDSSRASSRPRDRGASRSFERKRSVETLT